MPLHKVTCVTRGHALGMVSFPLGNPPIQTNSRCWPDVAIARVGHRVRELKGISSSHRCGHGGTRCRSPESVFTSSSDTVILMSYLFLVVYGADNVTSGASSDIQNATRTAKAMVKVGPLVRVVLPLFVSNPMDSIMASQTRSDQSSTAIETSSLAPARKRPLRARLEGKCLLQSWVRWWFAATLRVTDEGPATQPDLLT